jgi:hypothetical protein
MPLEVFFSVIVRKLLAGLNRAEGDDVNSTIADPGLTIRSAGMVDEASGISRNVSVDHAHVTRPEEIFPTVLLHLFGCRGAPKVFDDE